MITGRVEASLDAVVSLTVRDRQGTERSVDFVVDTGYDGSLSMPRTIIAELNLEWFTRDCSLLADGSEVEHDVFDGLVIWDETLIPVFIDEADSAPLLGTALLRGHELTAQFRPHGKVTIKRLPPKRTAKK